MLGRKGTASCRSSTGLLQSPCYVLFYLRKPKENDKRKDEHQVHELSTAVEAQHRDLYQTTTQDEDI